MAGGMFAEELRTIYEKAIRLIPVAEFRRHGLMHDARTRPHDWLLWVEAVGKGVCRGLRADLNRQVRQIR
jgi:hypothetical protein